MIRKLLFLMFAVMGVGPARAGDTAWLLELSGTTVSPSSPSVTVRIGAQFPRMDHALAWAQWDVLAGEGTWNNIALLIPSLWPGNIEQGNVRNIWAAQLSSGSPLPNTAN